MPIGRRIRMPAETETCANCGQTIGQLEQAYVWKEQTVCAECFGRLRGATASRLPLLTVGLCFAGVVGLIIGGLIVWHYYPRGERGAASNVVTTRASDGASMARVESRPATATEKKSPPAFATTSPQTAQKKLTQREIELKKVRDDEVKMQIELTEAKIKRDKTEGSGYPTKAFAEYVTGVTEIKVKYIEMQIDGIDRIKAAGEGTPEDDETQRQLKLQALQTFQSAFDAIR
jgi:hypothetical protein